MKTNILEYIRTVENYPKQGVEFYDLNSLFAQPIWNTCANELATKIQSIFNKNGEITHVAGIESRGFVVGGVLANLIDVPFIMVRKKGSKYPGALLEQAYKLEYGQDTLVLQEGILGHTSRVIIADDLLATGGSTLATKKLIEQTKAKVLGVAVLLELAYINSDYKQELQNIIAHTVVK